MAAGFVDFMITQREDVFSGAAQSSSAAKFGTLGITFRARKARSESELQQAREAAACAAPLPNSAERPQPLFGADAFYDAADKGCAAGPLDDIAPLLRSLAPGQTLEIHATDPSVGNDLPAWCRLAGHELLRSEGDRFLIRRKGS